MRPDSYVDAGDLDGDGDIDLVSASFSNGRFYWHENTDGAGSFTPGGTEIDVMDSAQSMIMADMDRDGDLDVVVRASVLLLCCVCAANLPSRLIPLLDLETLTSTQSAQAKRKGQKKKPHDVDYSERWNECGT